MRDISIFQFDDLLRQPGFVHGVSPRYYETETGARRPLRPGRDDQPDAVPDHRRWLMQALGIRQDALFLLKQVHSDRVVVLAESGPPTPAPEADAIITAQLHRPFGVMTADCLPALLYDPVTHTAGAVHAGRRGTQARILSKTIGQMVRSFGVDPATLRVALGPAIGGCCYEVGPECIEPFKESFSRNWADWVAPQASGKFRLDLEQANRADALAAGVAPDHILLSGECTACRVDRWYSYRREGETGRLITLAMLRPR